MNTGRTLRFTRRVCLGGASGLLLLSAATYIDWSRDSAELRARAIEVTQNAKQPSEAIVTLNHWVYQNQGFAKNHRYFLVKALGPTPRQVLESGGDCSDKSRLLSAMLSQIGISSGLVMIYPCARCAPIHTVIEAEYERGRMIADPIWNVDYPAGDGKYYGVRDMAGTSLGQARMRQLQSQARPADKILVMPASEATFDYAVPVNWDKNVVTKAGAAVLRIFGVDPRYWLRPRIMEDPKLAISVFLLTVSLALLATGLLAGAAAKRWNRTTRAAAA